ncbi:YlzJ-like family protein [Alteribacter aurantiacus]|uniref:YlzJ-like family protein n=1 Tax=Alteribacter aurantiacus TaxID=254410 RepID=UPI000417CB5A|nr:YlzJ-like family protein [Alteribacter aurantiacus]
MILYTYQPQNLVFPTNDDEYSKQQTLPIPGGSLVVEATNDVQSGANKYRVVRLMSTDPNMYLNSNYQPGSLLDPKFITGGME